MWVFGYGSLMWDGWEKEFFGTRHDHAVLEGYSRRFNKWSVRNWGSRDLPCPTLGLEEAPGSSCFGAAFHFPEEQGEEVWGYLAYREKPGFDLCELEVVLPSKELVSAVVAVNQLHSPTYITGHSTTDLVVNIRMAQGPSGRCRQYLTGLRSKLEEYGVQDDEVDALWRIL